MLILLFPEYVFQKIVLWVENLLLELQRFAIHGNFPDLYYPYYILRIISKY